jgi:hypothetical protein
MLHCRLMPSSAALYLTHRCLAPLPSHALHRLVPHSLSTLALFHVPSPHLPPAYHCLVLLLRLSCPSSPTTQPLLIFLTLNIYICNSLFIDVSAVSMVKSCIGAEKSMMYVSESIRVDVLVYRITMIHQNTHRWCERSIKDEIKIKSLRPGSVQGILNNRSLAT